MSNDVYIRLKALRKAHRLTQAVFGTIIGLDQTSVSRIEISHALVNEQQYKALVDKFGEEEVAKYTGEPPWINAVDSHPMKRQLIHQSIVGSDTEMSEMATLARIIAEQRVKIENLEKEIEELKNRK